MPRTRLASAITPLVALAPLAGLALAFGGLAPSTAVAAPSFTLIGFPPPQPNGTSEVRGLSADGRSAAGRSFTSASGHQGFLWTAESGRVDFGPESGLGITFGLGISGDGLTVVGQADSAQHPTQAFRWSQASGYQNLGTLPGYTLSSAVDANHDGSIVLGVASIEGGGYQAFRWSQSGGMQGLGAGTNPLAISRDGSTIVGNFGTAPIGFRWTLSDGLQFLPSLGGNGASLASGVNFDGSIIVGKSGTALRATMWVNGVPIDLSNGSTTMALSPGALSDDGSVVAGQLNLGAGGLTAGVWTNATGMMRLSDYLTAQGVVLPSGIHFSTCTAVSADGMTFAGWTQDATHGIQGWVATILPPCPADLDNDGDFSNGGTHDRAVTIDDLLYFLTGFEMGSTLIDLDNGSNTGTRDTAVTIDDLLYFLTHFEVGC